MAPAAWAGAGSAPYRNVIGRNPQLIDPANGDYRPAPGSPAAAYGCQTFGGGLLLMEPPPPAAMRLATPARDMISVSGPVTTDTVWDASVVRVLDDVTVADGVTLTIAPGVRVEFVGYDQLVVDGTLHAVGTPAARIVFTAADPTGFAPDATTAGCWHGLRFVSTPSTNPPSELRYCVLEYSKAVGGDGLVPLDGGALAVIDFSQLTIANCILRYNVAYYGGAVYLDRNANPLIAGNLIVDNHALGNASVLYCAYSYPRLVNNTVARNTIHNAQDPYIESCAVLNFLSKPLTVNNIIRANDPEYVYLHTQLWSAKDYYTFSNNLEGYGQAGNLDVDPLFRDLYGLDGTPGTPDDDFHLPIESACVDAGFDAALPPGYGTDLDGVPRVYDGWPGGSAAVDMGAYEAGDCDGDGIADTAELAGGTAVDCNGNLIPDDCELAQGVTLDCNANGVPDKCDAIGGGDFDSDGDVDALDLAAFGAGMAGPLRPPFAAPPACGDAYLGAFDAEGDGDLDLHDGAALQRGAEALTCARSPRSRAIPGPGAGCAPSGRTCACG